MNSKISPKYEWAKKRELEALHWLSPILIKLFKYALLRKIVVKITLRLEGGRFFSKTFRKLHRVYFNVEIGNYSYGSCTSFGLLPPGTVIGNYCSFAEGLKVHRRNHPFKRLSTHPFFYTQDLGFLNVELIEATASNPLEVGHDVWIGSNVTILPSCKKIGNGAVIGSGSIVTKDIPAFAIYAGNPAKEIRYRFTKEEQAAIEKLNWWNEPLSGLKKFENLFFGRDSEFNDIKS